MLGHCKQKSASQQGTFVELKNGAMGRVYSIHKNIADRMWMSAIAVEVSCPIYNVEVFEESPNVGVVGIGREVAEAQCTIQW